MCTNVCALGGKTRALLVHMHARPTPPSSPRKNRQRKKRLICFSAPHPWGGGGTHACKTIRTASRIPPKLFSKNSSNSIGTHVLSFFFCPLDVVQHHDQDLRQTSLPLLFSSSPFFSPLHQPLLGGRVREKRGLLPCNYLSGCLEKRREGRVRIFFFFYLPVCAS